MGKRGHSGERKPDQVQDDKPPTGPTTPKQPHESPAVQAAPEHSDPQGRAETIAAAKELGAKCMIIADETGKKIMLPLDIETLNQTEQILGRSLTSSKEHPVHWGSAPNLGALASSEPMPELSAELQARLGRSGPEEPK